MAKIYEEAVRKARLLAELNTTIKDLKTTVKPHYDQDRWKWFGIEDKK